MPTNSVSIGRLSLLHYNTSLTCRNEAMFAESDKLKSKLDFFKSCIQYDLEKYSDQMHCGICELTLPVSSDPWFRSRGVCAPRNNLNILCETVSVSFVLLCHVSMYQRSFFHCIICCKATLFNNLTLFEVWFYRQFVLVPSSNSF